METERRKPKRNLASGKSHDPHIQAACKAAGIGLPEKEVMVLGDAVPTGANPSDYPPHWTSPKRGCRRLFRHDYLWPDLSLAVEVDGVSPFGCRNRHQDVAGFQRDATKHNAINMLGLTLLRYTPKQLRAGDLAEDLLMLKRMGRFDA